MIDNDISALYPHTINLKLQFDYSWWKTRADKRNNRTHKNRMNQKDWEHKAHAKSVAISSTIPDISSYPKDRTVVIDTTRMIRRRYDMEQWCTERNIRYRIEEAMSAGFRTKVILFKRRTDFIEFIMYWADEE